MQLLITALVHCTVITLDGILRKQRRNVTRYTITVTAIQRAALPQLWETIDLAIVCHGSGLDDASAARALTIAQHYCPVHVTLAHTAVIHDAITTTGGTP